MGFSAVWRGASGTSSLYFLNSDTPWYGHRRSGARIRLDRDLAEFALSLPASLKVNGDDNKIVFKQAASPWWPDEVRNRSKHGFGAPYLAWLGQPAVRALLDNVLRPGSRLGTLLPGLGRPRSQRPSYKTWMLLVLGLWLEHRAVDV